MAQHFMAPAQSVQSATSPCQQRYGNLFPDAARIAVFGVAMMVTLTFSLAV